MGFSFWKAHGAMHFRGGIRNVQPQVAGQRVIVSARYLRFNLKDLVVCAAPQSTP